MNRSDRAVRVARCVRQLTKAALSCCFFASTLLVAAPGGQQSPSDPPRAAETKPAANAPNAYVGREVCATCHEEVSNALSRTPHGRTGVTTWDGAASCES